MNADCRNNAGSATLLATENLKIAESVAPLALALSAGQRIGLLGVEDCGKRRLLRILARLDRPFDGQLYWAGREVTRRPRWRLGRQRNHVVMISANPYALFRDEQTVREGLNSAAAWPSQSDSSMITGLMLPMEAQVGALSALQRVRLALAYALAQDARVILVDDVFASLNPQTWPALMDDLGAACGEHSAAVIASQYVKPVTDADCVYAMLDDQVIESGSDILTNPQQPYTQWLVERKSLRALQRVDWDKALRIEAPPQSG